MPVNRMLLSTKKWSYCLIKRHPWKSGFKMVSCVIKDSSYSPFDPSVCIRIVQEKLLVTQVCLFVTPGTSLPGSSVHGILQARILERVAIPSPGDLPDPRTEPGSPTSEADSLPPEPPGRPQDDGFSNSPAQSSDDCCQGSRQPHTTPEV